MDFLELAFARVGIELGWSGHRHRPEDGATVVETDRRYYRPLEVDHLCGDATKARAVLGWKPTVSFTELVHEMVDAEVQALREGRECVRSERQADLGDRRYRDGRQRSLPSPEGRRVRGRHSRSPPVRPAKPGRDRSLDEHLYPDVVVVAAATVGGIMANSQEPAPFLYDNLVIAANVIHAAYKEQVSKLLFLGSSCIYPRDAPQPLREEYLLSGPLEPTNRPYAIAKLAGIELCQAYRRQYGCDFISCLPTNLYGPGDRFDAERGHVIPALMAKMHAAKKASQKQVVVGGSGRPRREFLYVDDLADALVHLLKHYSDEAPINVGCGADLSIADLAFRIRKTVGYAGDFEMDPQIPMARR